MKYRIREDIKNNSESTFIPEFKSGFLPWWRDYGRYFSSLIDAKMFISNRKDQRVKKVKYHK